MNLNINDYTFEYQSFDNKYDNNISKEKNNNKMCNQIGYIATLL